MCRPQLACSPSEAPHSCWDSEGCVEGVMLGKEGQGGGDAAWPCHTASWCPAAEGGAPPAEARWWRRGGLVMPACHLVTSVCPEVT